MDYYYENKAVAFLDVLGFKEKLNEFESEAIENYKVSEFVGEDVNPDELVSVKANEFIDTFREAISILDQRFSHYLFSDNICITVNTGSDKSLMIELLNVITQLYFAFAKKGYFLRGGIDYGYFINFDSIAVGNPLANAYEMEQQKAMYPRIIISKNFTKVFEQDIDTAENLYIQSLILRSCEISYLNVFLCVLKTDKKTEYFESMQEAIIKSLRANNNNERVFMKYEWLAKEFNCFIDKYCQTLAFIDEENEPEQEVLTHLSTLKIPILCQ